MKRKANYVDRVICLEIFVALIFIGIPKVCKQHSEIHKPIGKTNSSQYIKTLFYSFEANKNTKEQLTGQNVNLQKCIPNW